MKKTHATRSLVAFSLNVLYFVIVFCVALAISTLALARRLNTYEATSAPFSLRVEKEELEITNTVPGRIKSIYAKPGQQVKKGDLLVQMTDEATEAKIATLERLASQNLSARTEVEVLKTLTPQLEIRSPRDGIVYKVHAFEDSYIQSSTPILTMFSDDSVRLIGTVSPTQYQEILKQKKLDVYSSRREQVYGVQLDAVSRVIAVGPNLPSAYELYFQFVNGEDAASFIQGETVDVVAKTRDDAAFKPTNLIVSFWNSLIIGR